jgi:3-oxoacyl-[acyl-carrier protein] reductase
MTNTTKTDAFAGRVALITGAGQGIGRVFANGFARAGAKIAIVELNEDNGKSVAA